MGAVLVTGATGFLGSHIVRRLVAKGYEVAAAYRPPSDRWRLTGLPCKIQWVPLDLGDGTSIRLALRATQPNVVIHCAAYGMNYSEQSYEEGIKINISGTQLLLQRSAEAGVRRFIHSGSCFEYGNKPLPVSEEEVLEPISMYGVTKVASTLLVNQLSKALDLPSVVVRPFGIYGPADRSDKFVPRVIRACLSREAIELSGGEQIRDYSYVADAVSLYVGLIEAEEFPSGEIVNLAGGHPVPLRRIGEIIARSMDGQNMLKWGALPYRPDEIRNLTAQTDKAKRLLGWYATTSLEDGLEETVRWYRRGG